MKKINIVRKNIEFNNIINIGCRFKSNFFYIYLLKNDYKYNRYGIAVSKKIGNAVIRNKFKRQIKDIIDDIHINFIGFNLILVAKISIKNVTYKDIKEDIIKIFKKIGEYYEE